MFNFVVFALLFIFTAVAFFIALLPPFAYLKFFFLEQKKPWMVFLHSNGVLHANCAAVFCRLLD